MDGLKKEIIRLSARTFKKTVSANQKLSKGQEEYDELMAMDEPPMDRLDRCPNPETLRAELSELQTKLKSLQHLEEAIKKIKSQNDPTFIELLLPIINELGITDEAPPEQERGPKKIKGPRMSEPRMPYVKYMSADGIEIRVGRSASDNDELSCNPLYRDGCKSPIGYRVSGIEA